jgi:hypothetical protein
MDIQALKKNRHYSINQWLKALSKRLSANICPPKNMKLSYKKTGKFWKVMKFWAFKIAKMYYRSAIWIASQISCLFGRINLFPTTIETLSYGVLAFVITMFLFLLPEAFPVIVAYKVWIFEWKINYTWILLIPMAMMLSWFYVEAKDCGNEWHDDESVKTRTFSKSKFQGASPIKATYIWKFIFGGTLLGIIFGFVFQVFVV